MTHSKRFTLVLLAAMAALLAGACSAPAAPAAQAQRHPYPAQKRVYCTTGILTTGPVISTRNKDATAGHWYGQKLVCSIGYTYRGGTKLCLGRSTDIVNYTC